ncbi:MAG: class I SAM-dependent methyltransferase [Lachnospiraceae bacterium]|nr:class I SAM-dependent methyltransferase [Lachnospiraceae bacterium]
MKNSKEYFDEIAVEWDDMQTSFFSSEVREYAYNMAQVEGGKIAADIGAGTGFITEGLLKKNIKVVAIDQSREMLDCLEKKYNAEGELICIQGDGNQLPLEDNSVDYVFANMYLHHVTDPMVAIKEMYRILKVQGKMVITDLGSHSYEFLRTEQYDKWLGFDKEDMEQWLRVAGFSEIKIQPVQSECSSESRCSCESAKISIFAALGIKAFTIY